MKLALIAALIPLLMGSSRDIEMLDKWGKEVVEIHTENTLGSAFAVVIDGTKTLVTAAHICEGFVLDKEGFKVLHGTYKEEHYVLRVVKSFKSTDICFLQYPAKVKPFKISKSVKKNEPLYAMGFTLRAVSDVVWLFSGVYKNQGAAKSWHFGADYVKNCTSYGQRYKVENKKRRTPLGFTLEPACIKEYDVYVTSIPGSGGISGGPAINEAGEVVGVNHSTLGRGDLLLIIPNYEIIRYYRNKDKLN